MTADLIARLRALCAEAVPMWPVAAATAHDHRCERLISGIEWCACDQRAGDAQRRRCVPVEDVLAVLDEAEAARPTGLTRPDGEPYTSAEVAAMVTPQRRSLSLAEPSGGGEAIEDGPVEGYVVTDELVAAAGRVQAAHARALAGPAEADPAYRMCSGGYVVHDLPQRCEHGMIGPHRSLAGPVAVDEILDEVLTADPVPAAPTVEWLSYGAGYQAGVADTEAAYANPTGEPTCTATHPESGRRCLMSPHDGPVHQSTRTVRWNSTAPAVPAQERPAPIGVEHRDGAYVVTFMDGSTSEWTEPFHQTASTVWQCRRNADAIEAILKFKALLPADSSASGSAPVPEGDGTPGSGTDDLSGETVRTCAWCEKRAEGAAWGHVPDGPQPSCGRHGNRFAPFCNHTIEEGCTGHGEPVGTPGSGTDAPSALAALHANYLAVREHTLSTAGMTDIELLLTQAEYVLGEAKELRDAVADLAVGDSYVWRAVRHEVADVVLATTTLAGFLHVTVEGCIAEKTAADRGRG